MLFHLWSRGTEIKKYEVSSYGDSMKTLEHMKRLVADAERRNRILLVVFLVSAAVLVLVGIALELGFHSVILVPVLIVAVITMLLPVLLEEPVMGSLSLGEKLIFGLHELTRVARQYNAYAGKERDQASQRLRLQCNSILYRLKEAYSEDEDDIFMKEYWVFMQDLQTVLDGIYVCAERSVDVPGRVVTRLEDVLDYSKEFSGGYEDSLIESILEKAREELEAIGIDASVLPEEPKKKALTKLREWWSAGGSLAVRIFVIATVIWGIIGWPVLLPEEKGAYAIGFLTIFFGSSTLYFFVRERPTKTEEE